MGSESERSGRICVLVGCGMGNHESMAGQEVEKKNRERRKREDDECSERTEATGQEGLQLFCWG